MAAGIFEEVEAQGKKLGLPAGFYMRLQTEDDWSFVIKLNALFEAACSDALAARLHVPELRTSLATLELGHPKHGKVALLRTLGAITKEQASVLKTLYELRNKLAHNVSQVTFSFAAYLQSFDSQQMTAFVRDAGHGLNDELFESKRAEFVAQNPKLSLWLTCSEILACLHLEHEAAEWRLKTMAMAELQK